MFGVSVGLHHSSSLMMLVVSASSKFLLYRTVEEKRVRFFLYKMKAIAAKRLSRRMMKKPRATGNPLDPAQRERHREGRETQRGGETERHRETQRERERNTERDTHTHTENQLGCSLLEKMTCDL